MPNPGVNNCPRLKVRIVVKILETQNILKAIERTLISLTSIRTDIWKWMKLDMELKTFRHKR